MNDELPDDLAHPHDNHAPFITAILVGALLVLIVAALVGFWLVTG